jgi:hypothetical protein
MTNKSGMNWIRQEKRLAIYLRDGLACAYCGLCVENGAKLTLDHYTPRSEGGSNDAVNLVTACHRCNSARGDRGVAEFAEAVASYLDHGVTVSEIVEHVNDCMCRVLPKDEAKTMISRRGSAARVLAEVSA